MIPTYEELRLIHQSGWRIQVNDFSSSGEILWVDENSVSVRHHDQAYTDVWFATNTPLKDIWAVRCGEWEDVRKKKLWSLIR